MGEGEGKAGLISEEVRRGEEKFYEKGEINMLTPRE